MREDIPETIICAAWYIGLITLITCVLKPVPRGKAREGKEP